LSGLPRSNNGLTQVSAAKASWRINRLGGQVSVDKSIA
jgi:hypothetical protein